MSDVAVITLGSRGARRLTAGFTGWEVDRVGERITLRRVGATIAEVHTALVEVRDLGLELESFRRIERPPDDVGTERPSTPDAGTERPLVRRARAGC